MSNFLPEHLIPKTEPMIPGYHPLQQPSRAGKVPKPVMEKRRRARINRCLEELKVLVPDLTGSGARVDKADVLEMTVEHLTRMKTKRRNLSSNLSPHVTPYVDPGKQFKQGYQQCMNEVAKILLASPVDESVTQKLVEHLARKTTSLPTPALPATAPNPARSSPPALHTPERAQSSFSPVPKSGSLPILMPQNPLPSPPSSPVEGCKTMLPCPPQLSDKSRFLTGPMTSFPMLTSLPSVARRPQLIKPTTTGTLWRPW